MYREDAFFRSGAEIIYESSNVIFSRWHLLCYLAYLLKTGPDLRNTCLKKDTELKAAR